MPILIVLTLAAATYAGYGLSKRYIDREKFFLEAKLLCDRLSAEIKFSHSTLAEVFRSASAECKSHMGILAAGYADSLESYADMSEQSLKNNLPQGCLTKGEMDIIIRFFASLGRTDAETELKTIEGYRSAIESFYADAAAEKKKYGGLYTRLGFLLGVVISILII